MASPPFTNGDMPVTIKLHVDGTSRRLKLPLRDLTRDALEPKLRHFLELPEDVEAIFERYSDSAGTYVVLDQANTSVYKQLGRAAKAKQKLKIRVSTKQPVVDESVVEEPVVEEPTAGPKPASVEDASEEDLSAEAVALRQMAEHKQLHHEIEQQHRLLQAEQRRLLRVEQDRLLQAEEDRLLQAKAEAEERDTEELLYQVEQRRLLQVEQDRLLQAEQDRLLQDKAEAEERDYEERAWIQSETDKAQHDMMVAAEHAKAFESIIARQSAFTAEESRVQSLAALDSTLEAIQSSIAAASAAAASAAANNPIDGAASPSTSSAQSASRVVSTISGRTTRTTFAVCCNSCDSTIPEVHYHCSTCDDGDFDLCQECVDQGITCYGKDHWLIKRFVKNGQITNSTTERIAPKAKAASPEAEKPAPIPQAAPQIVPRVAPQVAPQAVAEPAPSARVPTANRVVPLFEEFLYSSIRTCNCCVQELSEANFVHCTTCEDFDLCRPCFAKNRHGHHPKHGFVPAVEGTRLENEVARRLNPGRGQEHNAICDGCDDEIRGIRHKCLDCPDWDYCSTCIPNAPFIHPNHRFVPVYEKLEPASVSQIRAMERATHIGICCDGPLCANSRSVCGSYIVGDRYKCAICDDTDFCANCEASPNNNHNATHPLIKFKTSVRHVNIQTNVEHENGRAMPMMGDRTRSPPSRQTSVQTVVDVKPSTPVAETKNLPPTVPEKIPQDPIQPTVKAEEKQASPATVQKVISNLDLVATFVRDTVPDYTVLGPDHVFEQTWVLRNDGTVPWPAGCSVKHVGGDYMGNLDANRPAATHELEFSSESTFSCAPVAPGEEHAFSVLLRTPQRLGRAVSNWRLTTMDGHKFGHRLWCDVVVRNTTPSVSAEPEVRSEPEVVPQADATEASVSVEEEQPEVQTSQMIFPKLEKESPEASIHEHVSAAASVKGKDEYDDLSGEDSWVEDDSFLTDEEYDILDASDEENQENQPNRQ